MSHTPGPWSVVMGAAITRPHPIAITTPEGWIVEVPARGHPDTDEQADAMKADFRLIAAAPDMLEVLKAIQHWMADAHTPCCFPVGLVHAAVEKAGGKSD